MYVTIIYIFFTLHLYLSQTYLLMRVFGQIITDTECSINNNCEKNSKGSSKESRQPSLHYSDHIWKHRLKPVICDNNHFARPNLLVL